MYGKKAVQGFKKIPPENQGENKQLKTNYVSIRIRLFARQTF